MSTQVIKVSNLSFIYSRKTPYEKTALSDINLTINEGEFVGIIGHTGSGKSTFIQHLNALIKPQSGEVIVLDSNLCVKRPKPNLKKLRSQIGMVFQYPEYQLFDETVERDVAFGPKNMKLSKEEIATRVKEALALVGLNYDEVKDRSPFDLSGGQKRRVAIAGVIAMRPSVLILDEPTAGLDPIGKEQILSLITTLKQKFCPTIIVISHDIDEITRYCDRLIVFNQSKIAFDIPMTELFKHEQELYDMGLDIPLAVKITNSLRAEGVELGDGIITPLELMRAVIDYANTREGSAIYDASSLPSSEIMSADYSGYSDINQDKLVVSEGEIKTNSTADKPNDVDPFGEAL